MEGVSRLVNNGVMKMNVIAEITQKAFATKSHSLRFAAVKH